MIDKPIAFYSLAHSNQRGSPGASTSDAITERTVSRSALVTFQSTLEAAGFSVGAFKGKLKAQIRLNKKGIKKARSNRRPWVSVALHFNSTPVIPCPRCETKHHAGIPCPNCGRIIRWQFGHKAMIFGKSKASRDLADRILDGLSAILPWSVRRPAIRMPDPKYRAIWPVTVPAPAVLVEVGFVQDEKFSEWIKDPLSHTAYGQVVADSIIEWYRARELRSAGVNLSNLLDHWGD